MALSTVGCQPPSRSALPAPPTRTAAQDARVRRLLVDAAGSLSCEKLRGTFISLPADDEEDGPPKPPAAGGRWLIDTCSSGTDGRYLTLSLGGIGWMWADQKKLGFRVKQYVFFRSAVTTVVELDLSYDENTSVASISATPALVPNVHEFRPLSAINARGEHFFMQAVGRSLPSIVNKYTIASAEELGRQRFIETLREQSTVTFNSRTGQVDVKTGNQKESAFGARPFASSRWIVNERQEHHVGGVHMAGPFPFAQSVGIEAFIVAGAGAEYGMICAQDAHATTRAMASGAMVSPMAAFSPTLVRAGAPHSARVAPPACDWVLLTYSRTDATLAIQVAP